MYKSLLRFCVLVFSVSVFLTACQGTKPVNSPNNLLENKQQISEAVNKKEYKKVQDFIEKNTDVQKNKDLVGFAISSLVKTKVKQNQEFLLETLHSWVKNKKVDTVSNFIGYFDNQTNKQTIDKLQEQIQSYQLASDSISKIKKEITALSKEKQKLQQQFPYQVPFENPNMYEFYGTFLENNNEKEFKVVREPNDYKTEYMLISNGTDFKQGGQFAILVVPGEKKTFTLADGSSKEFPVIYEIPQSEKEAMIKIIETSRDIYNLETEMKKHEENMLNSLNEMNQYADLIFEVDPDGEIEGTKENNEEILTIKDNKFYLFGLTLGDTKEMTAEKLGAPQYEGPGGMSDYDQGYENFTVSYNGGPIVSLVYEISNDSFVKELLKGFTAEKYMSREGILYFHEPETGQLLMIRLEEGKLVARLMLADGNFKYSVEDKWINPMW